MVTYCIVKESRTVKTQLTLAKNIRYANVSLVEICLRFELRLATSEVVKLPVSYFSF